MLRSLVGSEMCIRDSYESAEGQMLNLEQMIAEHEFRQIEVQVVDGTKSFNEAIQALQKEMSVDDVERIMDEAADSMDYVNEINGLLSEQLVDYDDAQVDADLARLMGTTESAPVLPDAPVGEPGHVVLPDVPMNQTAAPGEHRVAAAVE
eukprot:TRINITY_DN340_c0_g1_i6.p2 TRINITY_DN340_c0_g1~~TRINITY_DN340_c0_g1_i6.p2  ORF type:complete len:150 (+),score=59.49 TRINITY_DN340_c0_g1_i6:144-593(+)